MKKPVFLLLLTFLSSFMMAQEDNIISVVAYWEKGDRYQFKVSHNSHSYDNDFLIKKDSSNNKIDFQVVDSTETSYTILWTCRNSILFNYKIDDAIKAKLKDYEQIKIKYTTDELGAFQEFINWEELSDNTVEMFDKMSALLEIDLSSFAKKYSQQDYLERALLKEIKFFHSPFGLEYDTKDTVQFQEVLPNLLGPTPIPADVKVYFSKVDHKKKTCTLVNSKKLNRKASREAIKAHIANRTLTKEDEKDWISTKYRSYDVSSFTLRYNEGIPLKLGWEKRTFMESPEKKIESLDEMNFEFIKKFKKPKPKVKKPKPKPKVDTKPDRVPVPKEKESDVVEEQSQQPVKEAKKTSTPKEEMGSTLNAINGKNYYNYLEALAGAESVTTSWIKQGKAGLIINEQFAKMGCPLQNNVLYQLEDGEAIILMGFNKEKNVGVVFKPGHAAIPQAKHRESRDYYQEVMGQNAEADQRKVYKNLPEHILVLHENWYWYQKPGSPQNVPYVNKAKAIQIMQGDIAKFLKGR